MTRMISTFTLGTLLLAAPALAQAPTHTTPATNQKPAPPAAAPAAQTPAAPAGPPAPFPAGAKIAVVNFQQIAGESKAGKAASTQIDQLRATQSAAMQKQNDQLTALQNKLKGSSLMSQEAAAQVQKDIDQLQMDIQYAQQKNQKEDDDVNQELQDEFLQKAVPIVRAIAAERGIEVVLSVTDTPLAYWEPGLDISEEVVKRLDATTTAAGTPGGPGGGR